MCSLVIWTLIVVATIKYVSFAMRMDNYGEGGILALMALIRIDRERRFAIIAIGLFGAALIYDDGAITPAISVLSALEGLTITTPAVQPYILPCAVVILIALFAVQPMGAARIGHAFGPITALWFLSIAVLGIRGIAHRPNSRGSSSPATHHHRTMAGLSPAAERPVEVIQTLQDWLKGLCGPSGGDTSGHHELPRRQGSTGRRERSGAPTSSSKNRSACRPGPGVTGRKLRTPDEPFHARPQRRA
jgi:hypothetical protein